MWGGQGPYKDCRATDGDDPLYRKIFSVKVFDLYETQVLCSSSVYLYSVFIEINEIRFEARIGPLLNKTKFPRQVHVCEIPSKFVSINRKWSVSLCGCLRPGLNICTLCIERIQLQSCPSAKYCAMKV
jgi:hypothetical protein